MSKIAVPFKKNSSFAVFGSTSSGKTFWVYRFLTNLKYIYEDSAIPQKIVFAYSVYQSLYDKLKAELPDIIFIKGLPSADQIESFVTNHTLLILDDLAELIVNDLDISLLFTQGCHHKGFSIIKISQNIFQKGAFARTISLNSSYLVVLKSVRDTQQIACLGVQVFGSGSKRLVEAYEDATSYEYGYLIVDLLPATDKELRLRTLVFPDEDMVIYTSSNFESVEYQWKV